MIVSKSNQPVIKAFILTIFILLSHITYSHGQTKKAPSRIETIQWIKEKLSAYSYESFDGVKNEYSVTFDEAYLYVKNKSFVDGINIDEFTKIKVIDIDYITIIEKPSNMWMTIKLKPGKLEYTTFNNRIVEPDGQYEFLLNKSFNNDNLPERMKKAFNKLIGYYGGKSSTKSEAY